MKYSSFRWLTPRGYRCTIASDGKWRLEYLEREKFHLVLCDIRCRDVRPGPADHYQNQIPRMWPSDGHRRPMTEKPGSRPWNSVLTGYVIKPFERNEILNQCGQRPGARDMALVSQEYERNLAEPRQAAHRRNPSARREDRCTTEAAMASRNGRIGKAIFVGWGCTRPLSPIPLVGLLRTLMTFRSQP